MHEPSKKGTFSAVNGPSKGRDVLKKNGTISAVNGRKGQIKAVNVNKRGTGQLKKRQNRVD